MPRWALRRAPIRRRLRSSWRWGRWGWGLSGSVLRGGCRWPERYPDRCLKPRRARRLDQHLYCHPSGSWGLQRGRRRKSHGDTPAFAGVTVLGMWCDSLFSVLAVSRQVSAVLRLASGVRPYTWRIQRTALCGRHSARSAVRDTSAHRYRPNPWISPARPRRLPGSSPICTEIPPEATRETRRNSVQSPKIPLRPRTSMVDGG